MGGFMAIAIHIETSDTRAKDYAMGPWTGNIPEGIRA